MTQVQSYHPVLTGHYERGQVQSIESHPALLCTAPARSAPTAAEGTTQLDLERRFDAHMGTGRPRLPIQLAIQDLAREPLRKRHQLVVERIGFSRLHCNHGSL